MMYLRALSCGYGEINLRFLYLLIVCDNDDGESLG